MRAAFRNTIAAAVAAAIAISGVNVAYAADNVELAEVRTNTTTLVDSDNDGLCCDLVFGSSVVTIW